MCKCKRTMYSMTWCSLMSSEIQYNPQRLSDNMQTSKRQQQCRRQTSFVANACSQTPSHQKQGRVNARNRQKALRLEEKRGKTFSCLLTRNVERLQTPFIRWQSRWRCCKSCRTMRLPTKFYRFVIDRSTGWNERMTSISVSTWWLCGKTVRRKWCFS